MSLQECTSALSSDGRTRIDASEFSQDELEEAASVARRTRATLIIYNLISRPADQIARVINAGGRHITVGDLHLI